MSKDLSGIRATEGKVDPLAKRIEVGQDKLEKSYIEGEKAKPEENKDGAAKKTPTFGEAVKDAFSSSKVNAMVRDQAVVAAWEMAESSGALKTNGGKITIDLGSRVDETKSADGKETSKSFTIIEKIVTNKIETFKRESDAGARYEIGTALQKTTGHTTKTISDLGTTTSTTYAMGKAATSLSAEATKTAIGFKAEAIAKAGVSGSIGWTEHYKQSDGFSHTAQVALSGEIAAAAKAGAALGFEGMSLEGKASASASTSLDGSLSTTAGDVKMTQAFALVAQAKAEASASAVAEFTGDNLKVGWKADAMASAGVGAKMSHTMGDTGGKVAVTAGVGVSVGALGAKFSPELGVKDGKMVIGAEIGGALGIGFETKFRIELDLYKLTGTARPVVKDAVYMTPAQEHLELSKGAFAAMQDQDVPRTLDELSRSNTLQPFVDTMSSKQAVRYFAVQEANAGLFVTLAKTLSPLDSAAALSTAKLDAPKDGLVQSKLAAEALHKAKFDELSRAMSDVQQHHVFGFGKDLNFIFSGLPKGASPAETAATVKLAFDILKTPDPAGRLDLMVKHLDMLPKLGAGASADAFKALFGIAAAQVGAFTKFVTEGGAGSHDVRAMLLAKTPDEAALVALGNPALTEYVAKAPTEVSALALKLPDGSVGAFKQAVDVLGAEWAMRTLGEKPDTRIDLLSKAGKLAQLGEGCSGGDLARLLGSGKAEVQLYVKFAQQMQADEAAQFKMMSANERMDFVVKHEKISADGSDLESRSFFAKMTAEERGALFGLSATGFNVMFTTAKQLGLADALKMVQKHSELERLKVVADLPGFEAVKRTYGDSTLVSLFGYGAADLDNIGKLAVKSNIETVASLYKLATDLSHTLRDMLGEKGQSAFLDAKTPSDRLAKLKESGNLPAFVKACSPEQAALALGIGKPAASTILNLLKGVTADKLASHSAFKPTVMKLWNQSGVRGVSLSQVLLVQA